MTIKELPHWEVLLHSYKKGVFHVAYPFTDKTSSYYEAYGFVDRSGSGLPLASSLNGIVSAVSGITVAASAINNIVSGAVTAVNASSLNNLVSGLVTSVNASSLNLLVSGLVTGVDASALNNVISGLGGGVSAGALNNLSGLSAQASSLNHVAGLTASGTASFLNNALYLGTANSRAIGIYSADTPIDGLAVTSLTAFGLTSVDFVFPIVNCTGTVTTTGIHVCGAITGATSVTFRLYSTSAVAITAAIATGLKLTVIAIGA